MLYYNKKHIICLIFCNLCLSAEATRWHNNFWNIVMIFMYAMCNDVGRKAQVDDKDSTTM